MALKQSDIDLLADSHSIEELPEHIFSRLQDDLNRANVTTPLSAFDNLGQVTRVATLFQQSDRDSFREASSRIHATAREFLSR